MKNEADFTDYSDYVKKTSPGLSAWLYGGDTNGTFFGVDRTIKAEILDGKPIPPPPPMPWDEDHFLNYKYKMLVDIACQLILENKEISVTELLDKLDSDVYSRSIGKELYGLKRSAKPLKTATVQSSMKILKEMYPDTGFLRQISPDAYESRIQYIHQPPADELIKCTGKLSDQKDGPFRHAVIYEDNNAPKNTIYNVKLSDWGYDSMEIDGKDGPTKVVSSKPVQAEAKHGPKWPAKVPGQNGPSVAEPQPNRSCAVCTKCNQMNEYAEPTPNYVCYACR